MMGVDDKFFAWLDGELEGAEAAEMAARVESDPELAALAEEHRAMGARLKSAFDSVAEAQVPDRLIAASRPQTGQVVELKSWRDRLRPRGNLAPLPQWASIAATLVLGIMVGTLVPSGDNSPVQVGDKAIYASADLATALDTQLASAPSGDIRIGLTFRNSASSICRTFTARAVTGLACRDDGKWQVRGLFPAEAGQASEYRMASGIDPALAALVDSTMSGEPMDASEELEARKGGWR